MTCKELAKAYKWRLAECATIGAEARQHRYAVTDAEISYNFGIWRDWYYGLVSDDEIIAATGIIPADAESSV